MPRVNLSTGRVLIIVALIVAGLAVLANGFADTGTTSAPTPTFTPTGGSTSTETQPPPSETTSPTPTPAPNKTGVKFMALNGTNVVGAAGAAQDMLSADGYVVAQEAADAPSQGVPKTTIYYRPDHSGQNQADATYVSNKYFKGSAVKKLNTDIQNVVPDDATMVVVVGDDWATKITT
jgi:LytR cell envelope-related transcriptional attenuator